MIASKAVRTGLMVLTATAAAVGVAAPASAATSGQIIVSNFSGTGPQHSLTIKVKCPWTYPYALEASTSGTNGPLFGPITLGNYPGVSSVTFTNPHSIQSNLNVTARLDVVCSTWLPASAG
jgi:hypothetical protein